MSDLAVTGIGHLTTNLGDPITDAVVVIRDGLIEYAGPAGDAPEVGDIRTLDVEGAAVLPGFVDAHTHLVFAGERSDEFRRKMAGEDYTAILESGGGILSTVRATRTATEDQLFEAGVKRARRMLAGGTTALEVKSGYGLDLETELRILGVARRIGQELGIPVRTTFLGAHAVPPEYDRDGYVTEMIDTMLPAVVGLADDCDVFIDRGAFTVDEGRAILTRARELGLGLRVHAEQLSHTGAAMLAAELGAMSADHLDHITPDDADALASAGVVAVLTPGASFMMRESHTTGRLLHQAGCDVAIATDCNPGTSYFESMDLIIALAVVQMGLTVEEAIFAATRGGALALGMSDRGVLRSGAPGDLVVLDAPSPAHIAYRPGSRIVARTVIAGDTRG